MKKYVIFLTLVLAFTVLQAIPISNLGNIRVPNAYVMPGNMITVNYGSYFAADDWHTSALHISDLDHKYQYNWDAMINVGLLNHAEVGFVAAEHGVYMANAKLKILEETVRLPAITVGADNLFSKVPEKSPEITQYKHIWESDMYERNSFYGAITKSSVVRGLGIANYLETVLTLGAGNNRFVGQNELSHKIKGVFVALEVKPSPTWSVIGEMDGYNLNAGVKANYKNFSGQFSMMELEQYQSLRVAVNVGYTFDKYVTTKRPNVLFGLEGGQQEYAGRRTVTDPEELKQGNELLDELRMIREKREQAEKELGEIKKILQEQQ
ncbi:MAG TPA: hypothetical protein PLE74_07405 [Candidatus Cloacimonadota bacterium]|nr:hypothetical protein [Candidatus Cloacimonadota bacterium]